MEWKRDWGLRGRMVLTMFLLFALYIVFIAVLSRYVGLFGIVLVMGLLSLGQFFFSDKLALWSMGAHEVSEAEYPQLHAMVSRLSQQADLPKPTVAVSDSRYVFTPRTRQRVQPELVKSSHCFERFV